MSDELVTQEGINRRDVMKRGAVLGGALVWATPVVQTMARPAFATEGTPRFEKDRFAISFIAILLDCTGDGQADTKIEAQVNADVTPATYEWGSCGPSGDTGGRACRAELDPAWSAATCDETGAGVELTLSEDGKTATVDMSGSDCDFLDGRAFGGALDDPDRCVGPTFNSPVVFDITS